VGEVKNGEIDNWIPSPIFWGRSFAGGGFLDFLPVAAVEGIRGTVVPGAFWGCTLNYVVFSENPGRGINRRLTGGYPLGSLRGLSKKATKDREKKSWRTHEISLGGGATIVRAQWWASVPLSQKKLR